MQDTKYFLESKRFWGTIISLVGFGTTIIAGYFGHDVSQYLRPIGDLLQAFGIPFTFYGAAVANQLLGLRKQ